MNWKKRFRDVEVDDEIRFTGFNEPESEDTCDMTIGDIYNVSCVEGEGDDIIITITDDVGDDMELYKGEYEII